jgi:predicted deacylase
MSNLRSRITTDIDFSRDGKQTGFLRLPHSVHRSAYGFIAIPLVAIRNGKGPRVMLTAGNHGDEYEGQIVLTKLARSLEVDAIRG